MMLGRLIFNKLYVLSVLTFVVGRLTDGAWPIPTCAQRILNICYASNINETTKIYFNYVKGDLNLPPSNYKWLYVSGKLNYMPRNVFSVFEKLKIIKLRQCQFLSLESGDFENAKNLKVVEFNENLLTKLVANTFDGADKITSLDFSKNKIQTIEMNAFGNLEKLKKLDLNNNEIAELKEDIFENNFKLNELYLANNRLENILFIAMLNKLEYLSLSGNRISSIASNLFVEKTRLKHLDLGENCLFQFDLNEFPMENVNMLRLSSNYLTEMSIDDLESNFSDLTVRILIEGNNFNCTHLQDIVDAMDGGIKVLVLDKSSNQPNVVGIECKLGGEDLHPVENKCQSILTTTTTSTTEIAIQTSTTSEKSFWSLFGK